MMQITLHNQSTLDVMLQHTGSLESIFDVAVVNDLSITDDLVPGQSLEIPTDVVKDSDILNYYTAKQVQPATAINIEFDYTEKLEGISIWAINNDFKVS
ncbi:hypothetical protein GO491_03085 [Flavobacteriaceae bacterium Ap0902]|nr:hypothetical protein [Flavobacteriaceae bacterium Ap0902]